VSICFVERVKLMPPVLNNQAVIGPYRLIAHSCK
jgi:hypothetical protein